MLLYSFERSESLSCSLGANIIALRSGVSMPGSATHTPSRRERSSFSSSMKLSSSLDRKPDRDSMSAPWASKFLER